MKTKAPARYSTAWREMLVALAFVLAMVAVGLVIAAAYRLLTWWLLPGFFGSITPLDMLQVMRVGSRFDLAAVAVLLFPGLLLTLWPRRYRPTAGSHRRQLALALALMVAGLVVQVVLLSLDFVHLARSGAHAAQTILLTVVDGNWGDTDSVIRGASVALALLSIIFVGLACMLLWPMMLSLRGRWWYPPLLLILVVLALRGGITSKPLHTVNAFDAIGARGAELTLSGAYLSMRAMVTESGVLRDVPVVSPHRTGSDGQAECQVVTRYARSVERSPNVVLLVLDGWRADEFDGPNPIATRSRQLLADARHFPHAYGVGPDRLDGLMAALTGLPPLGGYDQIARGLAASRVSRIGHLLSSRGYRSLFVHGAGKTAFRLDRVARSLDFSRYLSREDLAPIHADPGERPALGWSHEIFEGLARRLDVESQPFVAVALSGWVETPVPDDPLLPREVLARPEAYADWALARFIERMRDAPWGKDAVLIVVGAANPDHQLAGLATERTRVPLWIDEVDNLPRPIRERVVSQAAILPTIMEITGVDQPFATSTSSLLRAADEVVLVRQPPMLVGISGSGYVRLAGERLVDSNANNPRIGADELYQIYQRTIEKASCLWYRIEEGVQ